MGIREFILEKAEKWKEQEILKEEWKEEKFSWKPAEDAIEEINTMSDIMKRKVRKESVVLFCRMKPVFATWEAWFFFCEDRVINIVDDGISAKPISIDYKDIMDIDKSGNYIVIKTTTSEKNKLSFDDMVYLRNIRDVMYTFLWDIYEFVNA